MIVISKEKVSLAWWWPICVRKSRHLRRFDGQSALPIFGKIMSDGEGCRRIFSVWWSRWGDGDHEYEDDKTNNDEDGKGLNNVMSCTYQWPAWTRWSIKCALKGPLNFKLIKSDNRPGISQKIMEYYFPKVKFISSKLILFNRLQL